jgi:small-conductance mechanosensitive channel
MAPEFIGSIQTYVMDIIIGIVILLVGFGLGILAKKLTKRILTEVGLNKVMGKVGVTVNLEKWVSTIISYVIYLFTVVIFLDQLGIKSIVLYLIAGALLMLVILTLLVGLKDVIPNFIGWLFIKKKNLISEGHKVHIREIAGTVERIGYLETEIKTDNHDLLYVPNSLFLRSKFRVKN